ncbi:hypothetical protein F4826_001590 [Rahnella inusitata]|nr:hypothetical protein [Rahnella inusitata]
MKQRLHDVEPFYHTKRKGELLQGLSESTGNNVLLLFFSQ